MMSEEEKVKELVTVRVMTYKNIDKLKKTVDSVMAQDYSPIELIISDDGTPGADREFMLKEAERAGKKLYRAELLPEHENLGTVKHLNLINKKASGRYLMSCCPGDFFASATSVSEAVELFKKSGALYITSRRLDVYEDHKKIRPYAFTGLLLRFFPKLLMNRMITKRNLISGCSSFERRDIFEKYGFYDEDYRLLEDFPFVIKLLKSGEKIAFTNRVLVEHGCGDGVSTGEINPLIYDDLMTMRRKLLEEKDGLYKGTVRWLLKHTER